MDGVISREGAGAPRLGWLKALVLLLAALVVTHSVNYVVIGIPGESGRVRSEAGSAFDPNLRIIHPGYLPVQAVAPGGQLEQAGVREGDHIRFEHPWDVQRTQIPAGETLRLTILRDGRAIPASFRTGPSKPRGWRPDLILSAFTSMCMALAGIVIALRSSARTGVLLGTALVAMAHLGSFPFDWENVIVRHFPLSTLWGGIMSLAPIGLFGFALLQRAQTTSRPISRTWRGVFWLYVTLSAGDFLNSAWAAFALVNPPLPQSFLASILIHWSGSFAALALLIRAAFETVGQDRTRFGFLAAALGLYFSGTAFIGMIINMTGNDFSTNNPLAVLGQVMAFVGVAVFLYAALRHRVIDLGFAVNRTLVYGVLSTTLLLAFFFLEWGAEQIVPASMRQAGLLVSAGIALALFLVFERVRRWVERVVETLFFRSWRENEARLDRFLKDAAYVSRADALMRAALAEFARYTGGAATALYHPDEAGVVRVDAGGDGLPGRLDADDPLLVRLRADREALEGDLPETRGAALALPMILRTEVRRLILVGPKPSGEDYRPDEREALAAAAQRVGTDLHTLEIDRLEQQLRKRDAQLMLLKPGRAKAATG